MRVTFRTYNTNLDGFAISHYIDDLHQSEACYWNILPRWCWETSTFHTATSGYTYRLMSKHDHWHMWVYEGADKGFMAQAFLPDFGGWEVVEVEGSFGLFVGSSALLDYREVKEGSGFYAIAHTLVDPQAWIARNWGWIKGEPVPVPHHEAIADPIVKQWDRDLYGAR
jgi:hypothetical protein